MKQYTPEKLVAVSRYNALFPTLSPDIQRDVYSRMRVLIGTASMNTAETLRLSRHALEKGADAVAVISLLMYA